MFREVDEEAPDLETAADITSRQAACIAMRDWRGSLRRSQAGPRRTGM